MSGKRPLQARTAVRGKVRGVALLLVLWLVALLTALIGGFAMAARVEDLQGRVLARGVVAREAARAGIEYAISRLIEADQRRQWLADGRRYDWRYGDARVELELTDESGKVDLNAAQPPLLTGVFVALGVERTQAERLAAAIIDWRDGDTLSQPGGGAEDSDYAAAGLPYGAKDAAFDTTAELLQVMGMTPALYARAAQVFTVYSGRDTPDPAFAPAPVLTAMGMDANMIIPQRQRWTPESGRPQPLLPDGQPLVGTSTGTYSISSRAHLPDGREALLRVVVRAGGTGMIGMTYQPLQWEEGTSLR